jgi:uncharacterized OsmC-like protein
MVTIRPKTVITHRMQAARTSNTRIDLEVRGHAITIDERTESGGTDQGISPVETLLTALGVEIENLAVDLESNFDRRGTQLMEEVAVPFPSMTLKIEITTGASDGDVAKVKRDLAKYCAISKVLRESGTEIAEEWTVKRP